MMSRLSQALRFTSPDQLNELNTTAAKVVLGHRLTTVTSLVIGVMFVVACWDAIFNTTPEHGDRSLRLALGLLDSFLFFLAAFLGLNVAQFAVKRGTDRDTRVAVETAKAQKAPPAVGSADTVVQGAVTAERQAPAPRPTGDARVDDERGEV